MNVRLFRLLSACAACLLFSFSPASAMTTYQYTGSTYPSVAIDDTPPIGSYNTGMRVSGAFTVDTALANTSGTFIAVTPSSYSFSDGRTILTDANSSGSILVVVDSNGSIVNWEASFNSIGSLTFVGDQSFSILTRNNPGTNPPGLDLGQITECISVSTGACTATGIDFAQVINNAGNWAIIPIPAAVWLFGSALGLLVRLKRKAT